MKNKNNPYYIFYRTMVKEGFINKKDLSIWGIFKALYDWSEELVTYEIDPYDGLEEVSNEC